MWQWPSPFEPCPVTLFFFVEFFLFVCFLSHFCLLINKKKTWFQMEKKKSIWIVIFFLFVSTLQNVVAVDWIVRKKKKKNIMWKPPRSRPPHLPVASPSGRHLMSKQTQVLLENTLLCLFLFLLLVSIYTYYPFFFCVGLECTGGLNCIRKPGGGGGGLRISFFECILCTSM